MKSEYLDTNTLAKSIVDLATGQSKLLPTPHSGGNKETITGKVRTDNILPEKRLEKARKAGEKKWGSIK